MLKPTRTVLGLVAGSLVLGLTGVGAAVADAGPKPHTPSHDSTARDAHDGKGRPSDSDSYDKDRHARGVVVSRGALTVRSKPTTHSRSLGSVHPHEKLAIECKQRGERVGGNNLWYLLAKDKGENGDQGGDWDQDENGGDWDKGENGGGWDKGENGEQGGDWDQDENGGDWDKGENGSDGVNGRDDMDESDSEDRVAIRKERSERWVAARYVKNLTPVKYCRR
ncbi:hypothetical protein ACWCQL_03145 [Streptomyces sp. NPDC002073]